MERYQVQGYLGLAELLHCPTQIRITLSSQQDLCAHDSLKRALGLESKVPECRRKGFKATTATKFVYTIYDVLRM